MTTIALPPNFTDAAAIQIGPRSFRLALLARLPGAQIASRNCGARIGWKTMPVVVPGRPACAGLEAMAQIV